MRLFLPAFLALLTACGSGEIHVDDLEDSGGKLDARASADTGSLRDAGPSGPDAGRDSGPVALDAGAPPDAATVLDAGARDAGPIAGPDASLSGPDASGPDAGPSCGAYAGAADFTCTAEGDSRVRCSAGVLTTEACSRGCLRSATGDDVCMGTADNWSCTGSWGTTKSSCGDYFITAFGCWTDASGTVHTDSGDNCIPGCFDQAKKAGVCLARQRDWPPL